MADLNSILNSVPIADIAQQLGVSDDVASQAVSEASSVLLAGLMKNASTPEGAEALQNALEKHAGFQGVQSTADIDTDDGSKILNHIFGDKTDQVALALSKEPTTAGIDFAKLLPSLAPIIMGILGASHSQGSGGGIGDILGGFLGNDKGGGIGSVLGSILGGGGQKSSSGGLGDVLGGILGGGQQKSSGGGLGGLLGGIFGGGSKKKTSKKSGTDLGDLLGGLLGR